MDVLGEADLVQILEPQSATLTNYEVLRHIESMRTRYNEVAQQRGSPASLKSGNLETIMKEVIKVSASPVVTTG